MATVNSITVPKGTNVKYRVLMMGYESVTSTYQVNEDTNINIELTTQQPWIAEWTGGGSATIFGSRQPGITWASGSVTSPYRKVSADDISPYQIQFPTSIRSLDWLNTSVIREPPGSTSHYPMFKNCRYLVSVPDLDLRRETDISQMFYGCTSLTEAPYLYIPIATNLYDMFYNCTSLTSIPALDTSSATNMKYMFWGDKLLTTITRLNMSNVAYTDSMFSNCLALENITLEGSLNVSVSFSSCKNLTYDSILSILTAAANTGNLNSKTLTFSRTIEDQDDELATLVTVCTAHGWTITGLTLT